jgi:hypothetical protein
VLVEPDLVELGELVIVAGHQSQVLDNAGLVAQDLNVCGSPPAAQTDFDWFPAAQVAHPSELAGDEQAPAMSGVGDGDGVMSPVLRPTA